MMKRILIPLVALLTTVQFEAQVVTDSGNHGLMTITTKESDRMKGVEGSPYLEEEFRYGVAVMEGKEPLNLYMRYNVANETFELKTDLNGETVYMLPVGQAEYSLDGKTFVYDEIRSEGKTINGYFIEHFGGDHFHLLEKPTAVISEAVAARTGYDRDEPARVKIEEEFYILSDDGQVKNVRVRHRDIKKAFDSGPAKEYLSQNKIRSAEDLASFVAWMDQNK